MIVLVTPAERNGGILQFSFVMLKTLVELKKEVILYIPDTVGKQQDTELENRLVRYKKVKSVNCYNTGIVQLAKEIEKRKPELVIGLEDALIIQQLSWHLAKRNINTSVVVHDVIAHPYFKMSKREIIVEFLRRMYMKRTIRAVSAIIVLSENSVNEYKKRYPSAKKKLTKLILGAHVPECKSVLPQELKEEEGYYLFFGRIDKYKGIERLVQAFENIEKQNDRLVIAGKGDLPEETLEMIRQDNRITYINRFIEDEEMVYLYRHCLCVVLPYIEASQSGVLPIAYHFNKPVIVSNLPGLVENVDENKTGFVFETIEELSECLERVRTETFTDAIQKYYDLRFDWKRNVQSLVIELGENYVEKR